MIRRRAILLSSLGTIGLPASGAAPGHVANEWHWIYGEWRSDAEMTMKNFAFQKRRLTPENRAKISALFGKMTYEISPEKLAIIYSFNDMRHREEYTFHVSRHTSSSVTLKFNGKDAPPEMTLYKEDGFCMVRAGDNFEYFKKVA
jgi:hypothetical protein